MSAARTFSPVEEQARRSDETNISTRVRSLSGFLEDLWRVRDAMRQGRPLTDASEVFERLKTSLIGTFGNFRIEATAFRKGLRLLGWRVTTHDRTTDLQHEFYVHEGQIHHLQFHSSPPWNHSSPFVVGGKVKRISEAEKQAILQTISDLSAGVSENGDAS